MKELRIKLSDEVLVDLHWMMKELDAKSLTNVIKESLILGKFVIEEKNNGWDLVLDKGNKYRTIYFPKKK